MDINTGMVLAALIFVASTNLSCHVAIKVLHNEFVPDDERVLPFDHQVRPLASLNLTNIAAGHGLEGIDPIPRGG